MKLQLWHAQFGHASGSKDLVAARKNKKILLIFLDNYKSQNIQTKNVDLLKSYVFELPK